MMHGIMKIKDLVFLVTNETRPILGPNLQRVQGVFFAALKLLGYEAGKSPPPDGLQMCGTCYFNTHSVEYVSPFVHMSSR